MDLRKFIESLKELIKSFVYALALFVFLYVFLWPVLIDGISMEPALNHGDRVFVSRAMALFPSALERGDIVMIRVSGDYGSRYIAKRIVALAGDEIRREKAGIYLNGELFDFSWDSFTDEDFIILPEGYYFVLGDNSAHSFDSRDFGPIAERDISAKVLFRFFGGF